MERDIIVMGVPSETKLSDVAKYFEGFGEVIRISFDERKRANNDLCNIFVTFSDGVGAKRALNEMFTVINGVKVSFEKVKSIMKKAPESNREESPRRVKFAKKKITVERSFTPEQSPPPTRYYDLNQKLKRIRTPPRKKRNPKFHRERK
jgi:hypothetical protein